MSVNHLGTMRIKTERLVLRKFVLEDYKDVSKNWSSNIAMEPYVMWTPNKTLYECKEMVEEWILDYQQPSVYKWAIEFENEVIGFVEVRKNLYNYELGYLISSFHWKKGFAFEACYSVCDFLFKKCDFPRVFAVTPSFNLGSLALQKKLGMKKEGVLREQYTKKNHPTADLIISGILKSEWKNE